MIALKTTPTPTYKTRLTAWVMALSLGLTACGGGGSSTATPTPTPTPTPTATPSATPSATPTPAATPSATPAPTPTPTPSATPTPTTTPVPAPTPTAAECPFGNYKTDLQSAINAVRASPQYCGAYTNSAGVAIAAQTYPAAGSLNWNSQLESAATVHSTDMAANNYFAHPDANGARVGARTSAAGYVYQSVGENIAGGQTSVSQVVSDWVVSASHCANIMTASFVDIGASCKYNPSSTYQYYWTLVMGNH
jgi:uncharacterized protein YkwD